ncbi:unnamed protein product, partial [Vitis vinifera]
MSSWNDSLHFCQWQGVTCSRRRQRVTALRLEGQSLAGSLPPIGNLTFLRELVLSNNNLQGSIPTDIGLLRRMQHLNLSTNSLQGEIPIELTNCSNLKTVDLTRNNLTGQIPLHVGHMLKLLLLWLGANDLTGVSLKYLYLDVNNLSGMILPSLYNWSSPIEFFVSGNILTGNFTPNMRFNFPQLRKFGIAGNQFTGVIPDTLSNISGLEHLDLGNNYLTGQVPDSLGKLIIGDNKISGSIPKEIGNLISLTVFSAMRNNLTGAIPTSIGKLQNLRVFELNWNRLSGLLPSTLCNSSQLYYLDMGYNNLEGNIPTSLRNCQNMEILFLDHNKLNGSVPENVIDHFNQLRSLYLQQNTLTGSLPADFGQLKNLNQLLVSDNNLSGEIPRELGSCSVLEYLDMARNSFQGNIPLSFSSLGGIQILDLSCNNLSGMIPKELQHLSALLSLNLSYSYIEGEVPSGGVFKNVSGISITGNKKLCGGIPQLQLPACSDVESAKHGKGKHLSTKIAVMKSSSTFLRYGYLRVSYKELLKATSGFAYSILIGMGSFGSVYKGILSRGERPVAVKVLNLQQRGAAKSFMAECKVLRNIQQRNLLRIITSCSSVDNKGCDFKALVFEFMPNGNLDSWLHHESRNLSFRQRLDIAIDISSSDQTSSALLMASIGYVAPGTLLYVFCTFLKITCEVIVKKKNICMAEYGIGGSMWPQGDMYSYGILFLQMLTGRRPIEHMFSDGLSLHSFSKMALPERVMEIADSTLVGESGEAINNIANHGDMEGRMQDCLASIARIGVACSEESPGGRMDIKDVVMELNIIKEVFLGVGIHGERHIRMQLPPEGTSQLGGD